MIQAEILVTPGQIAYIRGVLVEMILQPLVGFIGPVQRELPQIIHAAEQLIPVLAGDDDRLADGEIAGIIALVRRDPRSRLLTSEDAELECAASRDAAEFG